MNENTLERIANTLERATFHLQNLDLESEFINDNERIPSLRDRFAMAVITGILAGRETFYEDAFADVAYKIADAMLKRREQK